MAWDEADELSRLCDRMHCERDNDVGPAFSDAGDLLSILFKNKTLRKTSYFPEFLH